MAMKHVGEAMAKARRAESQTDRVRQVAGALQRACRDARDLSYNMGADKAMAAYTARLQELSDRLAYETKVLDGMVGDTACAVSRMLDTRR